jgi:drug/metabolite transporter (DMT)-like permease
VEVKVDRLTLLAFVLIVLIAGGNFVAVKFSNQELAPFWGASARFFTASLLFLSYLIIKRIPIPRGRALTGAILYGVVGFGASYALLYWALVSIPAGIASIVIALVPLITMFLAHFHGLEKFNLKGLFGALVAASGIVLIFYEQASGEVSFLPLFALIAGAFCISESGIIVKLYPKVHPVPMNAIGMAVGSVLLFVFSLIFTEVRTIPILLETWTAFIYLVVIGSTVLFALIIFTLRRWTATAVSYQLVLAPLVTILVAAILRGETFTPVALIGSAVVLLGVYIGALKPSVT